MFCSKCGKGIAADAAFCPACGAATTAATPSRKDQPIADMMVSGIAAKSTEKREIDRGGRIFLGVLGLALLAAVGWGLMNGGYDPAGFLRMITGSGTPTKPVSPLLRGEAQSFEIVVTGTAGIPFQGSFMTMAAGGSSSSQSVEGVTPQSYFTTGVLVSTTFQKQGSYENTTLRVEIKSNGVVKKSAETTAAYGLVAAATD